MTCTAPTVLLIEDDDVDAMAIDRVLGREYPAIDVVRARDGLDGLDTLRELRRDDGRPVLVLLDLNMPRMGGVEFLSAMRKEADLASTLTFVLTTSEDDNDVAAAYEHNVAGYLTKTNHSQAMEGLAALVNGFFECVVFPPRRK